MFTHCLRYIKNRLFQPWNGRKKILSNRLALYHILISLQNWASVWNLAFLPLIWTLFHLTAALQPLMDGTLIWHWCMYHFTCGISFLLHSVNLILFTLLLVHLFLRISPHHLCFQHLSLPRSFTPDLKLISFTNPFLRSHSYFFRTAFTNLEPVLNKWALAFVCFSFFFFIFFWLHVG